ncbi:MAG: hypothetical protein A4S09_02210 [Proteobacteria bacterium SG_bin7]|nr:MAG: hypothetical protein A4S09_02210 [Proteobacteria bacterium SG_bin7]
MAKELFQLVEVADSGRYRLVPETAFDALLVHTPESSLIRLALKDEPTLGHLIRIFRVAHKLNQPKLGDKIGLKKRAVVNIEKDKTVPQPESLKALYELFGQGFQIHAEQLILKKKSPTK